MAKAKKQAAGTVDLGHYDVIVAPHITEKSTLLSEHNAVVFKVAGSASKPQIKAAVEALFNVSVTGVNTMNVKGHVTSRGISGGHKQKYRYVDFKRRKWDMPATVERLEYDPNRTAFIALVKYQDGELAYILAPQRLAAR